MKIAVEGCAHGELNKIYESIKNIELRENTKVDLLICCGDFQSVRDKNDMNSMAVPNKYMEMKDFWEYYTGKRVAPILTIFIGGNHEASLYLWELPYGGWVAENIYYLGFAGVVNFAGLRVGGVSGIYKKFDYLKDHFEIPPFNQDTKRSFYHVRKRDIEKMKLLQSDPPDIVLSHDWPTNIYNYGDKEQLIRFKPFLKDEIESCTLGSKGAEELLNHIKPSYWFSGHMHAKFSAMVEHPNGKKTKFLALDKCLPRRKFLQVIDIGEAKGDPVLKYDPHWLGILKMTHELTRFQELSEEHIPSKEMLNELSCTDLDVLPFSKSINGESLQTSQFCEKFDLKNPCKAQSWKTIKSSSKKNVEIERNNELLSNECKTTPKLKMSLPKPGTGDTTVKKNLAKKGDNVPKKDDDEFGEISNPNSSTVLLDISDSDSNSSAGSSGSSSSGSSDEESGSDVGKSETNDPPSFIETPMCAPTPKYQTTTPFASTSTPFKWKAREEKLPSKALKFADSSTSDKSISSDEGKSKENNSVESDLKEPQNDCSFQTDSSSVSEDSGAPKTISNTVKKESDMEQTPVKKFKLVRRNQGIYTPTKEED